MMLLVAVVLAAGSIEAQLDARAQAPGILLAAEFVDRTDPFLEKLAPCEFAALVKDQLSGRSRARRDTSVHVGKLGTLPAVVHLHGPNGSGRFWTLTLGVMTKEGPRGACVTSSTVGHRWAHGVQDRIGLPWTPLVEGQFTYWYSLGADDAQALGQSVYRLEGDFLMVDRGATARAVERIGKAYEACAKPADACAVLKPLGAPMTAWAKAVLAETEPTRLPVPDALRAITAPLELSGLLWLEPIQRYAAVSDDTGLDDTKSEASPWLFTLSKDGVIDPTPLVFAGVEKVDDLESITAGPGGTFFVCTSHALTSKGKSKPARRQLLELEWKDKTPTVKSSLDLEALGLSKLAGGPVDVEGTAWRDGKLYLGLKAPLDAKGDAQVFVLDLATKTLAPWATVALEVNGVRQGIADLLFLPDGRLVVAANSPKGQPKDGGGAVWRWDKPGAAPVLLQRYPALKPEGLALTPDGKKLKVMFDADVGQPRWLERELP